MRFRFWLSLTLLMLGVIMLFSGCGGGSDNPGGRFTRASLAFKWPERTRLIPLACESIKVEARDGNGFSETQVVSRPATGETSTVNMEVPVGAITLTATAFPLADAQGVAQAAAAVARTAQAGVPLTVTLTMASTITAVEINPADSTVIVDDTVALTATAKNTGGEVVLVPATNAFTWASSNSSIATVDANGVVTGKANGTATITATEKESGEQGTVTVTCAPLWKEKILFGIDNPDNDLYMMNPDGSELTQITFTPNIDELGAALSPDGNKIAYLSYQYDQDIQGIGVMNVDGTGNTLIYSFRISSGSYLDDARVDWSPDGTKIAFTEYDNTSNPSIYTIKANGSEKTLVTTDGHNASWSPDGNEIAFESTRSGDNFNLAIVGVEGTNRRLVTAFTEYDLGETAWSAQNVIAFHWGGNNYFINPDGSGMQQLTAGHSPAFSPDGNSLAYVDGSTIYVRDRDGSVTSIYSNAEGYYIAEINWGRIYTGPTWSTDIEVK